jgi:hypothetical protein
LVRSAKDVRLFIDGKLSDTQPLSGKYYGGGLVGLGGERFAGIIEEFRASRAARYDKNFTPARLENDKDTDVLYRFDEGQGDTARDLSGNGHDGKINGPKWVLVANDPIIRPLPKALSQAELDNLMAKHILGHRIGESVSEQELVILGFVRLHTLKFPLLDDEGFRKLSELPAAPDMKGLILEAPLQNYPARYRLTNKGFAHISQFSKVEILTVNGSLVNDDGLEGLASLPNLHRLALRGSKVTDKAAEQIGKLKSLKQLDLGNTAFGDDGLKGLADLPSLNNLILDGSQVTDDGLEHLRGHKLSMVNLKGTKVTAEGIKRLEEAIPGIKVQSDLKP